MYPYWILFSIFAAGSLQYERRAAIGRESTPLLGLAGLFIALMIGLRFEVGGDWRPYLRIFNHISYTPLWEAITLLNVDPGYVLLNWVVAQMGFEIWLVNLVCGLIFSWGLMKFAKRQPNPWLAILIAVPYLIIVVAMGYARQGVAIGFVLAGLASVDRTSVIRFSTYMLLAVTFHKSAIVVLPLVALAATQRRIVVLPILGATAVLLYYLFISASMDVLVDNYVEQDQNSQGAAIRVVMNLPAAFLFLLLRKRFGLDNQQEKLWRNFAYASLLALVLLVATSASTAVDRIALYLIPLQMFVLSRLPDALSRDGRSKGFIILLLIGYSALIQFVWMNFGVHSYLWVPYSVYPLI